ncbi:hypothetical protein CTheo_8545 [Ceratobasidium theobromae]|uniref:Uncharacterized protein n=1 Tax=Ceratobasidium theobromae TaxID=1582974 RepID=A0A5N5Q930_9AGAM|nr:hypothetical protein CTheo_8545 [Ceratobasidium theobromae]
MSTTPQGPKLPGPPGPPAPPPLHHLAHLAYSNGNIDRAGSSPNSDLNLHFDPSHSLDLTAIPQFHSTTLDHNGWGALGFDIPQNPWTEPDVEWYNAQANIPDIDVNSQPWAEAGEALRNTCALDTNVANIQVQLESSADDNQPCLTTPLPYTRIMSKGRIIYRHPTAGQSYGKGKTRWQIEHEQNKELRGRNPWAMWKTQDEWESAKWVATTKVSQSSLNKLLKTERVSEFAFHLVVQKNRNRNGRVWRTEVYVEDVILPDAPKDKVTLLLHNLEECGDFQFGQPWFAGKMAFGAKKHFESDDATQLFETPWTLDGWNEQQNTLPIGTTYGGMLLASDATQLSTHLGDVAAHALYMSLANLEQATRASVSENSWILVAYIPKSKFPNAMASLEH